MELFVIPNELILKAVLSSEMTSFCFLIFKYHFKNPMSEILFMHVCVCVCVLVTKGSIEMATLRKCGLEEPRALSGVSKVQVFSYHSEMLSVLFSSWHLHGW